MKIQMDAMRAAKSLQEGFEEFVNHCRAKNYSCATVGNYEALRRRLEKSNRIPEQLDEWDASVIESFLLYLKSCELSDMSLAVYLKNLKALLNYFAKMGYTQPIEVPKLQVEKPIKETYTDAELQILLKKPNIKKCEFSEYRNWVIINYLLSTGNRVSTVINIKIGDIDFGNEMIKLTKTKNKKQQLIPLSTTLALILKEYLNIRKGNPEDYLFCNGYGQPMTRSSISIAIRHYNKRRGVQKTSIHLFRHTFAKKWIMAGGDIFRLQKVLGHSSLDVVKEYVNMFSTDLQQDFGKFNALEQISKPKDYIGIK